jgi:hypothetical protein
MHGRDEKCMQNFGRKTGREGAIWKTYKWEHNIAVCLKEVVFGRV